MGNQPISSEEASIHLLENEKKALSANLKADTKDDPDLVSKAVGHVEELRKREKIGIIRCDYEYDTTRGDPGDPTSFLAESAILKVEGWTFEAVQRGMTPEGGYPASEFRLKKADGSVDEYWTKLFTCYPDKDGFISNRSNYVRVTKKVTGNKYIEGYFDEEDYVKGEVYRYEPEQMEKNMKFAIESLQRSGVCGISCDVGYSHAFHESVKQMTSLPVMLSSLQQLTLVAPLYDIRPETKNKVLVITVNSDTFDDDQLVPKGLPKDSIRIVGMQKTSFGGWVTGGRSFCRFQADAYDKASVEEGLESLYGEVKQQIESIESGGAAKVVCLVLECAEMPAYSNGLRRRFKLPVYDTMTAISFLQAGAGFGFSSSFMM